MVAMALPTLPRYSKFTAPQFGDGLIKVGSNQCYEKSITVHSLGAATSLLLGMPVVRHIMCRKNYSGIAIVKLWRRFNPQVQL